jgi:hypothetical protein
MAQSRHFETRVERKGGFPVSDEDIREKTWRRTMISIARDSGVVTVINAFTCEPAQQANLVKAWRDAETELGVLPGVVSAAL